MRSISRAVCAAALGAAGFVGAAAPASAASKPPVDLGEKVIYKGSKDVTSKLKTKLEVELHNEGSKHYFKPTFIKATAGEKITITAKNVGNTNHTFTSDDLKVSKEVAPGKSKTFTITVPSSGTVFEFHCEFHQTLGMAGAVYIQASGSTTSPGTQSS